ncbi:uncharacterized protein [Primulina huaijiensis]|uniref:uncharacterized protein isoform X2 n=1 Tax=Primulina huaijiensis TaxID=1492673 RepID=UPI003CC7965E
MEPVRRPSPGIRVVNINGRSYIPLEEHTLILMNFFALLLPYLIGRIEAQKTLNPPDDRSYVLPEEHIRLIMMNFLGLLRQTNFYLPAEASDELYAVISDLLSERRGRDGSHNCGEGSSSHSEAPQVFKGEHRKGPFNGFPLKREEPKRNKSSGMTTHEIIYDGINYPPVRCLSIDIPSVVDQEYEENVLGGDLHGRKQEIPANRINSPREPYVSIDVPSVVDQQQRKEHIGGEPADTTKKRDNSMISETTLAIAAQAAGTLVSRAFSGHWIAPCQAQAIGHYGKTWSSSYFISNYSGSWSDCCTACGVDCWHNGLSAHRNRGGYGLIR